jgi:CHAD domain-containing protein
VVIHERLVELIERLPIYDSRIRRHEPGGVHKMRVTLRRLRSLLATFAPLFDADVVLTLREELKWVGGELGGARDSEVVRKRLTAIARTPEEHATADRMQAELDQAEAVGLERSLTALDSDRYSAVLRDLNSFASDPPWATSLEGSVDDVLRRRVRRDWKRLRRRVGVATDSSPGVPRHSALHEVRKAAKRLRYSAETLVPVHDDASRLARGAKRIQTELGEVQDSAVSQGMLQALAKAGATEPDTVFVLGGLHAQDRLLSAGAEARYARAWGKLSRKKNRRWLK